MKLRARWRGPLPLEGAALMTMRRPRFAYIIRRIAVRSRVGETSHVTFEVDRVAPGELAAGTAIYEWSWDKRQRRFNRA